MTGEQLSEPVRYEDIDPDLSYEDRLKAVAAKAPPLSSEQRDRLSALLWPPYVDHRQLKKSA